MLQPKVQPIRKQQAPPEIRALLDDIQDTMGIPWPPTSWRTYAMYPSAMRLFWERLKPAVASEPFLQEAMRISGYAYREAPSWYKPVYRPDVSEEARRRIQWELDAFEFGDPQLLIQQAALSRALRGQTAGRPGSAEPRRQVSAFRQPEIQLIDEQEAPPDVRRLYEDIKQTLELPLINADYQALAKWPTFLKAAWEDIKEWLQRDEYARFVSDVALMAAEAASRLTPPLRIEPRELQGALPDPGDLENLQRIVQMFTHLLPGLIANVALFRTGIAEGRPIEMPQPERAAAPA